MNARLKRAIVRSAARLEAAIERERLDGGEPSRAAPEAEAAGELVARFAELDQRVADVQALTARIYERTFDWARELAAIRSAPDYEAAWAESEPLVSVRIATYDNPELLCERALASLRAQTYERWEAIVVGDAVTDDTEARLRAIGDPRIRFVNLPHRGPYPEDEYRQWLVAGIPAMNRGTREADGRWIAPLDHDDEWDADHIEVLLAEARRSRAELAYGQLRVRDAATGRPLPSIVGAWPPEYSKFGLQGAIYHAGLSGFEMDMNALYAGEPGDWNLARRMWEAGVRFAFVERPVTTYYYAPRDQQGKEWVAAMLAQGQEP